MNKDWPSDFWCVNLHVRCAISDLLFSIPGNTEVDELNQLLNELFIGGSLSIIYTSFQHDL